MGDLNATWESFATFVAPRFVILEMLMSKEKFEAGMMEPFCAEPHPLDSLCSKIQRAEIPHISQRAENLFC